MEDFLKEQFEESRQNPENNDVPDVFLWFSVLLANVITEAMYSNQTYTEELKEASAHLYGLFHSIIEAGSYAQETVDRIIELQNEDK